MLCVFQKKKKIDVKSPNLLAVHREMQGRTNFRHISGSQECRSSINLQFLLLKIYISELEHSFDPYLMSTHYIPYIRYFAIFWNCVCVYSWFQWLYYLQNEIEIKKQTQKLQIEIRIMKKTNVFVRENTRWKELIFYLSTHQKNLLLRIHLGGSE